MNPNAKEPLPMLDGGIDPGASFALGLASRIQVPGVSAAYHSEHILKDLRNSSAAATSTNFSVFAIVADDEVRIHPRFWRGPGYGLENPTPVVGTLQPPYLDLLDGYGHPPILRYHNETGPQNILDCNAALSTHFFRSQQSCRGAQKCFKTDRFVWGTDVSVYLVGPSRIDAKKWGIRYGKDNDAFWKVAMQNWFQKFVSPFFPLDAGTTHDLDRELDRKAFSLGLADYGPFQQTLRAFGLNLDYCIKFPLGVELFLSHTFECSEFAEEDSYLWPLPHLKEYILLCTYRLPACFHYDSTIFSRHNYTGGTYEICHLIHEMDLGPAAMESWLEALKIAFPAFEPSDAPYCTLRWCPVCTVLSSFGFRSKRPSDSTSNFRTRPIRFSSSSSSDGDSSSHTSPLTNARSSSFRTGGPSAIGTSEYSGWVTSLSNTLSQISINLGLPCDYFRNDSYPRIATSQVRDPPKRAATPIRTRPPSYIPYEPFVAFRHETTVFGYTKAALQDIFAAMPIGDIATDTVLIAAGHSIRASSLVLAPTWQYFERYLKAVTGADAWRSGEKYELDFELRLTYTALQSLADYFTTGDPNITSYTDALILLEMAEELNLCDEAGKALPGHESLIIQLIFTIQTGRIEEKDIIPALCAARAQAIVEVQKVLEARLRRCFSEEILGEESKWIGQHFPAEYDDVIWPQILEIRQTFKVP